MKKLWAAKKQGSTEPVIWDFLTGKDAVLDNIFLPYDITGTQGHAAALVKARIITRAEEQRIRKALNTLREKARNGKIRVQAGDEDCHTVIEMYLTKNLGDLGKKIHTGRSRNDQALTMIRLYMRDQSKRLAKNTNQLKNVLAGLAQKYKSVPMPGYSHAQKAMPITVGQYFSSFVEALTDDLVLLKAISGIWDQSPLGSAAGFGLPIKWPRQIAARALGFPCIQNNPIYCQASRGKFERMFIFCLEMISQTLGRLSADMVLFTMQEFRFFSLPDNFTTGSSLMPHKKNYDLFEMTRAVRASLTAAGLETDLYGFNLISGYHRDLQRTKEPLVRTVEDTAQLIKVLTSALEHIEINTNNLTRAISPEMYSTAETMKLAASGIPFRKAYQTVKERLGKNSGTPP
jgi:argininosuccinate lyase